MATLALSMRPPGTPSDIARASLNEASADVDDPENLVFSACVTLAMLRLDPCKFKPERAIFT
jgi:hypothetical protein